MAILEFAVLLPVLLLLVIGLIELGQLIRVRQLLDNAAREASRQASLGARPVNTPNPARPDQRTIEEVARLYLQRAGLNVDGFTLRVVDPASGADLDPRDLNANIGQTNIDRFRVVASIPYDNTGTRGNRVIDLRLKVIRMPSLETRSDWFSMKDFPLMREAFTPPYE